MTRLLISAAVGLAVAIIAVIVAVNVISGGIGIRFRQKLTQHMLVELQQAIPEYRQSNGSLPHDLGDLYPLQEKYHTLEFDKDQRPVDGWWRPFEYTTDGTDYSVTSFGRDGQPGGIGLDCDLTLANPRPPDSAPTFQQRYSRCPPQGIAATCILTGILASALCWFLIRPTQPTLANVLFLAARIIATMIGAVIVAFVLAFFHIPSGH